MKLFGELALEKGLISKEQLFECLIIKESDSTKPLGRILLQKKLITLHDLEKLLKEQKRLLSGRTLFGQIIIEEKLAMPFQVNEALRVQGMLREMNIKPVPRLGEILLKKKFINKQQIELALSKLSKELYMCEKCHTMIGSSSIEQHDNKYLCKRCGCHLPEIIVRMALKFEASINKRSDLIDIELPADVLKAYDNASKQFAHYILIEEIAEGGSGVIYKAWDKNYNRYVALKMLSHDSKTSAGIETPYGDAEDLRRFYTEIATVSELLHPNIIPIYDAGIKDSYFYFAMEFINGDNFERFIKKNRRNWKLCVNTLLPVCNALAYAHGKNIYHRDLKPSNILVETTGKPWLVDFGLAYMKGRMEATPTKDYVVLGTPYYMSPEQAGGNFKDVDHQSDIYSMGAILYHVAAGKAPFSEYPPEKAVDIVLNKPPTAPSRCSDNVDPDLECVILKAMHMDKSKRYKTMDEMSHDLKQLVKGEKPSYCYGSRVPISFLTRTIFNQNHS